MHPLYSRAHEWTSKVIGAAIEVHRIKGPGLLESIYEQCMMREFQLLNIPVVNQAAVEIEYKGHVFKNDLFLDLLVDNSLVVELKAVSQVLPVHKAQLLSYMKLLDKPLGLLINFNETILKNGISRLLLPGANL